MENQEIIDELRELLHPFIKEHPLKKDTVREEDVEGIIEDAIVFQVAEQLLETVKAHPNGVFWDFLDVLPDGVPPGQEDILDDWDDDEEDDD